MLYTAGVMLVSVFENNGGRPPLCSESSKVIDFGGNRKRIVNFLLVINSNFGRISYRFLDIEAFRK